MGGCWVGGGRGGGLGGGGGGGQQSGGIPQSDHGDSAISRQMTIP